MKKILLYVTIITAGFFAACESNSETKEVKSVESGNSVKDPASNNNNVETKKGTSVTIGNGGIDVDRKSTDVKVDKKGIKVGTKDVNVEIKK